MMLKGTQKKLLPIFFGKTGTENTTCLLLTISHDVLTKKTEHRSL